MYLRNRAAVALFYFLVLAVDKIYSKDTSADLKTLKQVHVLFRHGDRAPVRPYENDPYHSKDLWPFGYAQLTLEGLRMQQKLGRWFRARYDGFLSPEWKEQEIQVVSTDVDRTINSALANLQGLYSTRPDSIKFDSSLNWSPVPVRALPKQHDDLLNVNTVCRRVLEEDEKVKEDPQVKEVREKCRPLFQLLSQQLGEKIDTIVQVDYAYDYFYIHQLHNVSLPDWVVPHLPLMKEVSEFSFEMIAWSHELKRLRGGPLLKKIIKEMETRNETKFFMYSAHDSTVACNLETLGLYNKISPPYASTVIYELHSTQEGLFVKLFYRNDTAIELPPFPLTLPGCDTLCPLPKFRALLSPLIPDNYTQECTPTQERGEGYSVDSTMSSIKEAFHKNDTVCLDLVATVLALLVMVILLLVSFRRRFNRLQEYALLTQE